MKAAAARCGIAARDTPAVQVVACRSVAIGERLDRVRLRHGLPAFRLVPVLDRPPFHDALFPCFHVLAMLSCLRALGAPNVDCGRGAMEAILRREGDGNSRPSSALFSSQGLCWRASKAMAPSVSSAPVSTPMWSAAAIGSVACPLFHERQILCSTLLVAITSSVSPSEWAGRDVLQHLEGLCLRHRRTPQA